jgi:hypothetical protein
MSRDDLVERIDRVRAYDRDVRDIWQPEARARGAEAEAILHRGLKRPIRVGAIAASISAAGLAAGVWLSLNPGTQMPWGTKLESGEPVMAIFGSALILALFYIADTVHRYRKAPEILAWSAREVAHFDTVRETYADGIDDLQRSLRRKDLGPVLGMFVLPRLRRR